MCGVSYSFLFCTLSFFLFPLSSPPLCLLLFRSFVLFSFLFEISRSTVSPFFTTASFTLLFLHFLYFFFFSSFLSLPSRCLLRSLPLCCHIPFSFSSSSFTSYQALLSLLQFSFLFPSIYFLPPKSLSLSLSVFTSHHSVQSFLAPIIFVFSSPSVMSSVRLPGLFSLSKIIEREGVSWLVLLESPRQVRRGTI